MKQERKLQEDKGLTERLKLSGAVRMPKVREKVRQAAGRAKRLVKELLKPDETRYPII